MALFANTADHRKSGELAWAAPDRATRLWQYAANFAIGRRIGVALLILLLSFLTLYPLSMLLYGSLHSTPPGMAGEFNLDGYRQILTAENVLILLNTVGISFAKTIPSITLAMLLAWIVRAHRHAVPRHARSADHAAVLHSADPHRDGLGHARQQAGRRHQHGLAVADRHRPRSPINVYSYGGVVWHMMQYSTPFLFLFIVDAFRAMDPALEESSRMCGALALARRSAASRLMLMLPAIVVVVHAEPDPRHRVVRSRRCSSDCPPASRSSPPRSTTRSTTARRRTTSTRPRSRSRSWC